MKIFITGLKKVEIIKILFFKKGKIMKTDKIILIHRKHYKEFKAGTLDFATVADADYVELKPLSSEISADEFSDVTSYFAKTPREFECSFLPFTWLIENLLHSENDAYFEFDGTLINTKLSNKVLLAYEKDQVDSFFEGVIKTDSISRDADLISFTSKDFSILFNKIADHRIPNREIWGQDYINTDGDICYRGLGTFSNRDTKELLQLLVKKASLYFFGDATVIEADTNYSWTMSALGAYDDDEIFRGSNVFFNPLHFSEEREHFEGCGFARVNNEIIFAQYAYRRERVLNVYYTYSERVMWRIRKFARGTITYMKDYTFDPPFNMIGTEKTEQRKKMCDFFSELLDCEIDENNFGDELASQFQLIDSEPLLYHLDDQNSYKLFSEDGSKVINFTGNNYYNIYKYADREDDDEFFPEYYSVKDYLKAVTYGNDLACMAEKDKIIFRNRFWEDKETYIITRSELAKNGYSDKRVVLDRFDESPFDIIDQSDISIIGLKSVVESYYNRLRSVIIGESSYIISYLLKPELKNIKRGDLVHFDNRNFRITSLKPAYKRYEVILQEFEYGISRIHADKIIWNFGDEITLTWKNNVVGNVDIFLENEDTERLVATAIENTGSYIFPFSNHIDGSDFRIKIYNSLDKNIFGLGEQAISVNGYNLTVTPFEDNQITEGMMNEIRWTSNYSYPNYHVKIELERDGNTEVIVANMGEYLYDYEWEVPDWSDVDSGYANDSLRLKFTIIEDGKVFYSDYFGSINISNDPVIENITADSSDWQYGTDVTLTWITNFVGKVDIILTNGDHERAIIEDVENTGSYTFDFKSYYPGEYNIKIKARGGSTEGTSAVTVDVSGDYLVIKDFGTNRIVQEDQGIAVEIDTNLTGNSNVYCLAGDNGSVLTVKTDHELGTVCWWEVPAWHTGGTGVGYNINDPLERRQLKLTHNGNDYFGTYFGTSSSVS